MTMSAINLRSNFNTLGPPPNIEEVLSDNWYRIGQYAGGSNGDIDLSEAAKFLGLECEQLAHGLGSTEIIFSLPRVLNKDRAYIFKPTFWEYSLAAERAGVQVEQLVFDDKTFELDFTELSEKLNTLPGIVFLGNPNNPTSTLVEKSKTLNLVDDNPDSDFIIDETYLQFREDFFEQTLSGEVASRHNLHVIHSFSKFFALPGMRLGILVSNPNTSRKYKERQIPYATSPFTEFLLPWAIHNDSYIRETKELTARRQLVIPRLLRDLFHDVIEVVQPAANFIFVYGNDEIGSEESIRRIEEEGFLVRGGFEFGDKYRNSLRFTMHNEEIMQQLGYVILGLCC
jgi:threonine-phosphate decarboxylase